jgi:Tol biopolymer transport system component
MRADGTDVQELVDGEGQVARDPDWSPDGSRLAYAYGNFYASIWVVNADGTGKHQITAAQSWGYGEVNLGPDWSPSGAWIAYQKQHGFCQDAGCRAEYDIFVARADGSHERLLTSGTTQGARPTW